VQVALLILVDGRRDLISWRVFPWQAENGLAYLALSSVMKKKVYKSVTDIQVALEMLYTLINVFITDDWTKPNKLEHLTLTNHSSLVQYLRVRPGACLKKLECLTLASFFQADVISEQCVVPSFRVGIVGSYDLSLLTNMK